MKIITLYGASGKSTYFFHSFSAIDVVSGVVTATVKFPLGRFMEYRLLHLIEHCVAFTKSKLEKKKEIKYYYCNHCNAMQCTMRLHGIE